MRESRKTVVVVLALVILALIVGSSLCLAQAGKVETLGPLTDSSVPEAVRKVLDNKGYRATLDDGSVACEIWLRQGVPSASSQSAEGALYPQLAESTLVGVISFPKPATDYRGQSIKPGMYTLRYELLPSDGNHLGVAANPDFLLLVPAASDSDPNATYKFGELVDLSRGATGTKHPGPLSMVQPKAGAGPTIFKDDEDHWIFSAAVKMGSGGDLAFALVVKGTAPQ